MRSCSSTAKWCITYSTVYRQCSTGGGVWRATGFLSLFYSAVLFTEGLGVYLQKRWAEYLMVFATGALIPLEIRHIYYRPSFAAVIILAANCFIVWFLYRGVETRARTSLRRLRRKLWSRRVNRAKSKSREHFGGAFHRQTDHIRKRAFHRCDNTSASSLRGVGASFVDRIHHAKVIGNIARV